MTKDRLLEVIEIDKKGARYLDLAADDSSEDSAYYSGALMATNNIYYYILNHWNDDEDYEKYKQRITEE